MEKPRIGTLTTSVQIFHTDEDYAVLSRAFNPQTHTMIVLVSGCTQYGTEAAAELVTDHRSSGRGSSWRTRWLATKEPATRPAHEGDCQRSGFSSSDRFPLLVAFAAPCPSSQTGRFSLKSPPSAGMLLLRGTVTPTVTHGYAP